MLTFPIKRLGAKNPLVITNKLLSMHAMAPICVGLCTCLVCSRIALLSEYLATVTRIQLVIFNKYLILGSRNKRSLPLTLLTPDLVAVVGTLRYVTRYPIQPPCNRRKYRHVRHPPSSCPSQDVDNLNPACKAWSAPQNDCKLRSQGPRHQEFLNVMQYDLCIDQRRWHLQSRQ